MDGFYNASLAQVEMDFGRGLIAPVSGMKKPREKASRPRTRP
jgi:hypothetical protein